MPLFAATSTTELDNLLEWVDVELTNARSIVSALTGDQLRTRPIASSELTLGWLILHIGEVAESWLARAAAAPEPLDTGRTLLESFEHAAAVNQAADDATAEEVLAEFDRRHAAALDHLRAVDLDAPMPAPAEMPWFPTDLPPLNGRWAVMHAFNEIARHSGHADLLREAIDGGTMYDLISRDQGIDMSYIGKWFAEHPEVPAPEW